MQWVTDIVLGLRALGGEADLQDLYRWLQLHRLGSFPPNWEAGVRAALQAHCTVAKQYRQGNADPFRTPRRGRWALRAVSDAAGLDLPEIDPMAVVLLRMVPADFEEFRGIPDSAGVNALLAQKVDQLRRELVHGKKG